MFAAALPVVTPSFAAQRFVDGITTGSTNDAPFALHPPMNAPGPTDLHDAEMQCPTCNARQEWAAECRRCKSDLSDLLAVYQVARRERAACLMSLREGDWPRAQSHARRYVQLFPGVEAERLMAVCSMLGGDWPEAWQFGRLASVARR